MSAGLARYRDGNGLFHRLVRHAAPAWRAYTQHDFVRRLGNGSLDEACFRHYLGQDYLFLIHFARAYALAIYKADRLADMRAAADTVHGLINTEMALHVEFCAGWGLDEAAMEALPEATATMAYTRYVLEKGLQGDSLDLLVALAPCVVGYGEIGAWLADDPATVWDGNPYRAWIDMYAGPEYQDVAAAAISQLDEVAARRLSEGRWPALATTFEQATRLEVGFWDMGLNLTN